MKTTHQSMLYNGHPYGDRTISKDKKKSSTDTYKYMWLTTPTGKQCVLEEGGGVGRVVKLIPCRERCRKHGFHHLDFRDCPTSKSRYN